MNPLKYSVRLLSVAEDDLADVVAYIATDKPSAARDFLDRFEKALELLSRNARLGRTPKEKVLADLGYRYIVIENYLVFYVLEGKTLCVHRFIHGARDYTHVLL